MAIDLNISIEKVISDLENQIKDKHFLFKPNLDYTKAKRAIRKYANNIKFEDILVLYDDSLLGNGKTGFILTENELHFRNFLQKPISFHLDHVSKITFKKGDGFTLSKLIINNSEAYSFIDIYNDYIEIILKAIIKLIKNKNPNFPTIEIIPFQKAITESINDQKKSQSNPSYNKSKDSILVGNAEEKIGQIRDRYSKYEMHCEISDAVHSGDFEKVHSLISSGSDVNWRDGFGITLLMSASFIGNSDIVSLLLAYGADKDLKDINGDNALKYALKKGHNEIVDLLTR